MNKSVSKNLKKITKTGGSRRKPNARRAKKQAEEEKRKKEFTVILQKINNCIQEANLENTTNELINYLNQALVLIYSELRPQELNRKSKDLKNIKYLRKNWENIHSSILQRNVNNENNENNNSVVTYTFRESFNFYKKNLSDYGMKYVTLCYKKLYDGLLNKAYILKPTEEERPSDDELLLSISRLGFEGIGLMELQGAVTKEDLHKKYFEKTLEYHMDSPNAMREQDKYSILRKRVRKALVTIEVYLDYFLN